MMYRTGDVARRRTSGLLDFLGRNDDQVKVRGYRIELGEIEAVLAEHPAIAQTAVTVREPQPGDVRLVAYSTPEPGRAVTVTELRDHLRTRLPEYMVVQNFVTLDAMPLTSHGKLDRRALPESIGDTVRSTAYVGPTTDAEALVVSAAARLLGVDRVSVTDNVFDLGGHSLLSLRLIAELHGAAGIRISPRVILLNTLQQAAALLPETVSSEPTPPLRAPAAAGDGRAESVGSSAYFFGPTDSPLFGLHYAPSGSAATDTAVLLCPPVGWEYMRTHWAMRKVARLLSTAGLHVLRFDYFGTGDSAGDSSDVSVERWLSDIAAAAAELREASGAGRVSIVGVRLGASLAAQAAERLSGLDRAVLWDPVVSGAAHLAELEAMHEEMLRTRKRPYRTEDLGDELVGFPYPTPLRTGLSSIDLRSAAPVAAAGTLVASEARRDHAEMAAAHEGWLAYEVVNDVGGWDDVASAHAALLPQAIPNRIAKLVGGSP